MLLRSRASCASRAANVTPMGDLVDIGYEIEPRCRPGADRALAELAGRQHGVAARWQLLEMGFGPGAIRARLVSRRLAPIHSGVYAVGHSAITGRGRWMAATLACGPAAVLSHRPAGALWGLCPSAASVVDVTAPGRSRRGRPGIRLHQVRTLHAGECSRRHGIPVTTVPRTLLDLAEVLRPRELERAFDEAERLRLLDVRAVERLCDRSPGRRGLRPLTDLLAREHLPPPETRSTLERRFFELCRDAGLPRPAVNAHVAGFEVDAAWPSARLVVELDGYAFHRTRAAFERDRARDAALQLAGQRVVRITHRQLEEEPNNVVATVRSLLATA